MADWLLDRLISEGRMPNLARLIEHGAVADHAYTSFPAITAVGHALIWTGTDPSRNAVHGNQLILPPYEERTVVDGHTGFHAQPLMAEPIWAAAARQGKKVVVVQATQAAPFSYYLGENARFPAPAENLLIFDGYIEGEVPGEVITENVGLQPAAGWINLPEFNGKPLEFKRSVGESTLRFLVYDQPEDPVVGFDTVSIFASANGEALLETLKPGPVGGNTTDWFSGPVEIAFDGKTSFAFFRLFELAPDASEMLLFRSRAKYLAGSDPDSHDVMMQEVDGFLGNAAYGFYEDGAFGPTVMDGGDGTAELRYLESVRLCTEVSTAALQTGMTEFDWDLLVDYIAFPDEQNHTWLGYVAEPVGDTESELGKKIWSCLLDTYQIVDDYVGAAMESLPDDAILIVVSDHGFTAADKEFYPNTILRQAGLLKLNGDGEVDLAATKAIYYPGNAGFVLINTPRFKGGWVGEDAVAGIRKQAVDALLAARDADGRPLVVDILYPDRDEELGMDGPYAGDFYIQLAPGYDAKGAVDKAVVSERIKPRGIHLGDPRERKMQSIFIAGGKPLGKHLDMGVVPAIDIAPTISALLGIAPPAHATGKPVDAVLQMLERDKGGAR